MKLLREERKTPVLKPPSFGCLSTIPSINITRGCAFQCVYCYARGFTSAPPKGKVYYYHNLPDLVERELERRSKRGRLPVWVTFSTSSDPFQPFDETLSIAYRVMETLLKRGIGISFLTKGHIPDEFIHLFSRHRSKVRARIGLTSLDERYRDLFEPFSALPLKRMENMAKLKEVGIDVALRMDPLIPGVTDRVEVVEGLLGEVSRIGIGEVSASYLVMRPYLTGQLWRELPKAVAGRILKAYQGQPYQRVITSARTRLLPRDLREEGYRRVKGICLALGMRCHICGCKNPDLPWEFCNPWALGDGERQLRLL